MPSDRKNAILTAAGNCFVKNGYEKTTLDNIAEQVKINKASFYYYFKNKEAIFVDLITREADQFIEETCHKVNAIAGCRNKILSWVRESLKYNDNASILHRLSIESIRKLTPQIIALKNYAKEKGTVYLRGVLSGCAKLNMIKDVPIGTVAASISNIMYALKDQAYHEERFHPEGKVDTKKLVDGIVFSISLILDGIIMREKK
jgi:AcrR family transcriptional regulator